jgi:hypothetical protein
MVDFVTLWKAQHLTAKHYGERAWWATHGPEYIEKLACGIGRNMLEPWTLHVLTDTPDRVPALPYVGVQKLLDTGAGWWAKVQAFRPDLGLGPRAIYFDLDTVVVGALAPLVALTPPEKGAIMANDHAIPQLPNGSIMRYDGARAGWLWNTYAANPHEIERRFSVWPHASDQAYVADSLRTLGLMQPFIQDTLGEKSLLNLHSQISKGVQADETTIALIGRNTFKPHTMLKYDVVADNWRC